ncbi:MAG TPA: preprotein translocase subunit SecE [Candidatus Marinimicrobia bacterium]|nr:MAG: preprotein translocase subunit SecE [Candidatus Marinimicrobia bacterium CG1_02_48_14]PIZ64113.1 MAG: preprotein translocase subunit SecE [Candidatus Marinimicrobia bacterium CG_4_10_14_0_2_um_filter_48_9]PJA53730.1 MAG: preprotein translocase subunit SecE [Candidatus Marinimicrobia bacterium CG_4_9_14_3_um_filter_48_9]HCW76594.1 preprotein translocase subunit SecE [Candidatus Neomarinimicrobiota bacterium]
MVQKIKTFFEDVQFEFQKISWPTSSELKGSTIMVLTLTGLIALALFMIDKLMSALILGVILGR